MSLTTRILRMTPAIGVLILVISACQKSVPAIPLKVVPPSSIDSSLYLDSTQNTDSVSADSDRRRRDSIGTKKDTIVIKKDTTTTKKDSVVTPPPPVSGQTVIAVGTGSGTITIDGTGKTYQCNTIIKIKGGSYSSITVKNVTGSNSCPVTITNDGLVQISGNQNTMNLSNLTNVIITGNGTSGISQGFSLHDNNYRALQFSGGMHGVTVQYCLFKNIGDYVISTSLGNTSYNSSNAATYWSDVHFLNMEFNNTQQINLEGDVSGGSIKGFIKNFEMANCYMHDMSPGDLMVAGAMDKYNIHHNIVNNVNTTNNNDNGIWHIQGNGTFAYNKVTNHQGHAIRAWTVSFGTTVETELIYNNIVINSRKYSAFEVQSFGTFISSGQTTYSNAKIFNNTCGNLDLSKDWNGVVVDVYGLLGGTCEVFNNLAFNFPSPNPDSYIVSQQFSTIPAVSNNLYFATSAAAGITDETAVRLNSSSPAKHAGKASSLITTDYYGTSRGNPPSIGAVE